MRMWKSFYLFIALGVFCGALPCRAGAPDGYSVALDGGAVVVSHGGRELLRWLGVDAESFAPNVSMRYAFFKFEKKDAVSRPLAFAAGSDDGFVLKDGANDAGSVALEQTPAGHLRVVVTMNGPAPSAVALRFACAADDRFWGFGEQYNYVDFHGRALNAWVQEQGVGRSETPSSFIPGQGSFTDSYFPMPYFLDPKKGLGFLIENMEFSRFDLCKSDAAQWRAEVWDANRVSFLVLPGPRPADVVAQLTAEVGRPDRTPPDWAFSGVWLAAQGGTKEVYDRFKSAMDAGFPVSAFWVQDWVGKRQFIPGQFGVKYRWVHDTELYPGLEKLIRKMSDRGVRFLGYFNPFVIPDFEHYEEAAQKGYLPLTPDGKPYNFQIITFPGSVLDVTNPDAVAYFKDYARHAVAMGQKGWMCDFGEWLPYDAVARGGTGRALHNAYATAWHRINREVLDEAFPDGDYIMLTRSGFTYEHKVAQIVWAADQEQNWEDADGFPTVVRAALTIGLSGVPYYSHDIAGFSGGPSTKELFMRWTELGAFTPVMRTHDGLKKKENHKFNSDPETLAHFSKIARIHAALLPYWKQLAGEAVTPGLPMIRHTVLVDPEWDAAYDAHRQWMLGNDLLFAPVIEQGADAVEVRFPAGGWVHILTGEKYSGRTIATVMAPIGTPAVFARDGRLDDIVAMTREIYAEP